jgi:hypothetical protein
VIGFIGVMMVITLKAYGLVVIRTKYYRGYKDYVLRVSD